MRGTILRLVGALTVAATVMPFMAPSASASTVSASTTLTWQTGGGSHSGGAAGRVTALAPAPDREYLGGRFTTMRPAGVGLGGAGTVTRNHLAAVDTSGNLVASWNPNVNGVVNAIAVGPDGTVFVGGSFSTVGGASHRNLVAIDPVTGGAESWTPAPNKAVDALVVSDGMLYVGGEFTSISGHVRLRLAAYDLATLQLSDPWAPKADKKVKGMTASVDGSGDVIAVGSFTTIDGKTQPRLAVLSASHGSARPLAAHPAYYADGVAATAQQIVVGEGGPGGKVQSFDLATGELMWTAQLDGDAQAMTIRDDEAYAGGHFVNFCDGGTGSGAPYQCDHPVKQVHLAAFSLTTGALVDWSPSPNGSLGVFALSSTDEGITAGGEFTVVDGVHQQGYARFGM
jgi:outer membrane protein assembly factor BamB